MGSAIIFIGIARATFESPRGEVRRVARRIGINASLGLEFFVGAGLLNLTLKLVMLGTPNHGSFAIPLLINGLGDVVRWLAAASRPHKLKDLLEITNSFVGTYQMLPSPYAIPSVEPLYHSRTYADLPVPQNVLQSRLDDALKHHSALRDVVDAERMVNVVGYNQATVNGIKDFAKLHSVEDGYGVTETEGDGTVSHELGFLETPLGERISTYFVDEAHANLARNERVTASLEQILEHGSTDALGDVMPSEPVEEALGTEAVTSASPRSAAQTGGEERVRALAEEIRTKNTEPSAGVSVEPEEGELEEMLMHGF